jgi:RNA polymerase sigma-70 factor (ECF subfamily)
MELHRTRPSFEELFEADAAAVYAWACLRIPEGLRSHLEPQDVVNEVWLRATKAYESFDPERARFRTWLIGIAKNILLETLRAAHRLGSDLGATTKVFVLENYPESVTSLSRKLSRDEALREFFAYAAGLEPESRRLLALCGLEELNVKQAAERLGLSHEAALKRWQRLRDRIRESPVAAHLGLDER